MFSSVTEQNGSFDFLINGPILCCILALFNWQLRRFHFPFCLQLTSHDRCKECIISQNKIEITVGKYFNVFFFLQRYILLSFTHYIYLNSYCFIYLFIHPSCSQKEKIDSCVQPHTSQAVSQLVKSGAFPSFGSVVRVFLHGLTLMLDESLHAQKSTLLLQKGNTSTRVGREPSYD